MDGLNAPRKRETKKVIKKTKKIINNPTRGRSAEAGKKNMSDKKNVFSTLLSILITALIVGGSIYAWQDKAKDSSLTKVQQDAKNVREGYERSLKNLENEKRKVATKNDSLVTENEELKQKAELIVGALREYNSEELGLSFSYPAILGMVDYEKKSGTTGEKFSIKFGNNDSFYMTGVSGDYKDAEVSSSTEVNFDNFIKLEKKKDDYKYFVSFDGEEKEYSLKPIEAISFSGGEALLIDAKSFLLSDGKTAIGIGQNLGAVLNIDNDEFSGLAMLNSDFSQLSVEDFKNILKSIIIK